MDRVSSTPKHHEKHFVVISQVKVTTGHEIKKVKLIFWGHWVHQYMFLGQFFVKSTKKDPLKIIFEKATGLKLKIILREIIKK